MVSSAISTFRNEDTRYLSFPKPFSGQRRPSNSEHDVNVHYSESCKNELYSVDRRAALKLPNVFFKLEKITIEAGS